MESLLQNFKKTAVGYLGAFAGYSDKILMSERLSAEEQCGLFHSMYSAIYFTCLWYISRQTDTIDYSVFGSKSLAQIVKRAGLGKAEAYEPELYTISFLAQVPASSFSEVGSEAIKSCMKATASLCCNLD